MKLLSQFRKRLSLLATYVGLNQTNVELVLRREHVETHKRKLAPLFTPVYLENLSSLDYEEPLPKTARYLKHALSVPLVTVTNLNVEPGQRHFVLWLYISSYFPLLSACLAPLGNLISLIALIEHWRISLESGKLVPEEPAPKVLNIIAFVCGIIGNVSLLMNFSGTLRYLVTQCVSILCWVAAVAMLLIAVLLTNETVVGADPHYKRSEGFWLAVWTIFMYSSSSIVQIINLLGYKLQKYGASYNLDRQQRLLINYTMVFAIWQAIGASVMKHLIQNLSYGGSLYYCVVSVFTVGLGDIHPVSTGAKVVALIFSFVGIVNLEMIVTTLIRVVVHSAGPSVFWHYTEVKRMQLLQKYNENPNDPVFANSFQLMRDIREGIARQQWRFNCVTSLILFIGFWQVGSAVLYASEDWTYFNSMYFCFLCLLTIGYGDYAPTSVFGRAFFIQWAMGAVPIMSIIISTVADSAFNTAGRLGKVVQFFEQEWTKDADQVEMESRTPPNKKYHLGMSGSSPHRPIAQLVADLDTLEAVTIDALEDPLMRYSYEQWTTLLGKLRSVQSEDPSDSSHWLGEMSPLRLPIKEPRYVLIHLFLRLRHDLLQRLKEESSVDFTNSTCVDRKES